MEDHLRGVVKSITGKDEYILDHLDTNGYPTIAGFLSNGFSIWFDIYSTYLTIMSDKYSVIWEIAEDGPKLAEVIEFCKDKAAVYTFVNYGTKITVKSRLGRLTVVFDDIETDHVDSIVFGNTSINVPRGWPSNRGSGTQGPPYITKNDGNGLIYGVLGRPLDEANREKLTIYATDLLDVSKIVISSGTPVQERCLKKDEVHSALLITNVIRIIVGIY